MIRSDSQIVRLTQVKSQNLQWVTRKTTTRVVLLTESQICRFISARLYVIRSDRQIVRLTGNDQWQTQVKSQNLEWVTHKTTTRVTRKTTAGGGFWRLGREKGRSSFGLVLCSRLWKLTKSHVVPGYSFHCPLFQQLLWINATTQQGTCNCEWCEVVQFSPKYHKSSTK